MKAIANPVFLLCMIMSLHSTFGQDSWIDNGTAIPQHPVTAIPQHTVAGLDLEMSPDLFQSDELLPITLSLDLQNFPLTGEYSEFIDATLHFVSDQGDSIQRPIILNPYGDIRSRYCDIPPFMILFDDESSLAGTGPAFHGPKLVTRCISDPEYEKYVFMECLVYKLYNLVTPFSFKTRPVSVTFVDANQPENSFTTCAFLIEDETDLAERNNATLCRSPDLNLAQFNQAQMLRTAVFNYMIGNSDWSIPGFYQPILLKHDEMPCKNLIPVARDFDFAGLIHATYAATDEAMPSESARDRIYMGLCASDEAFQAILDEFVVLHEKILETVRDFTFLTRAERLEIESFLNGFYQETRDPNMLNLIFNDTCRKH